MTNAAQNLKNSGATAIVLCANTMHVIADQLSLNVGLPVIHIATVTASAIEKQQLKKVGLLGTKFTMELDFFTDKLKDNGIDVIIPDPTDREFIHYTIFEELGRGVIDPVTKSKYISIINKLIQQGAEGIILGCTEIPLLINENDAPVPLFDTTRIHSTAAVEFALS